MPGALAAGALAAAVLVAAALRPPCQRREAFGSPPGTIAYGVAEIPDVLTHDECDALVAAAGPRLRASEVVSQSPGVRTERSASRVSTQAWLADSDPQASRVVAKLIAAAASLTGVRRRDMHEDVMVARYTRGGKYDEHHDACVQGCDANPVHRRATLLVYLNDGFQGGETVFPLIGRTVRPRKGWGVLFYDTDLDTGLVIRESLHAGRPVLAGEKYIATVWTKSAPPPRLAP